VLLSSSHTQWLSTYTAELLARSASGSGGWVNVGKVRKTARAKREYFKAITFHPVLITLSWAQNPTPKALAEAAQLQVQQNYYCGDCVVCTITRHTA
jgi:hypothetical protein